MANLEPIEEKDLDLKEKFLGQKENPETSGEKRQESFSEKTETEKSAERKEGSAEKEETYSRILSKVKTQSLPSDETVSDDAKKTSETETAEAKIEKLVQLAANKGVVHAVKVARHLDDNYVLDEFHDRLLAEELHDALMKKGLIKDL